MLRLQQMSQYEAKRRRGAGSRYIGNSNENKNKQCFWELESDLLRTDCTLGMPA